MSLILFDIMLALRSLAREHRYFLTLVLVLSLTVAATGILLVQVYSVNFLKLPFETEGKVVAIYSPETPGGMLDTFELDTYRRQQSYLDRMTPYTNRRLAVEYNDAVISVSGASVRSDFFQIFRTPPSKGRLIQETDGREGAMPVAVISHRFWQGQLQARDDILGERLLIDRQPVEIVGVMPERFHYPDNHDIWLNRADAGVAEPGSRASDIGLAYLEGSEATAAQQLNGFREKLVEQYPDIYSPQAVEVKRLVPWQARRMGERTRFMLIVALSIVVIGGFCIINLMASRFFARAREWRLRATMGGGAGPVATILLTEALVIFVTGFVVAYLLFKAGLYLVGDYLLIHYASAPFWWQADLTTEVLAFFALYAVSIVLLSTLWFSFHVVRSFRAGDAQFAKFHQLNLRITRWGYAFVQIGLTTFLLAFFLLAAASYYERITRDLGYETENILVGNMDATRMQSARVDADQLRSALIDLPGVQEVSFSTSVPGSGSFFVREYTNLHPDGDPGRKNLNHVEVSPSFFEVFGMGLLEGRLFSEADYDDTENPMTIGIGVMDRKTSDKLSHGGTMVGQAVSLTSNIAAPGYEDETVDVVGVISNVDYENDHFNDVLFSPLAKHIYQKKFAVQMQTSDNPMAYAPAVKALVNEQEPGLKVEELRSLKQMMVERGRGTATMMLNFLPAVALAIVMCAIGIFDVGRNVAATNRRDIGIYKAIGMRNEKILMRYLRYGMLCIGAGLLLGGGAFALSRQIIHGEMFEHSLPVFYGALSASVVSTGLLCLVAMAIPIARTAFSRRVAGLIQSTE